MDASACIQTFFTDSLPSWFNLMSWLIFSQSVGMKFRRQREPL